MCYRGSSNLYLTRLRAFSFFVRHGPELFVQGRKPVELQIGPDHAMSVGWGSVSARRLNATRAAIDANSDQTKQGTCVLPRPRSEAKKMKRRNRYLPIAGPFWAEQDQPSCLSGRASQWQQTPIRLGTYFLRQRTQVHSGRGMWIG